MICDAPTKVGYLLSAMDSALRRRDYPVLAGLLTTYEGFVLDNGDDTSLERIRRLASASAQGEEIEAKCGRLSQLDPTDKKNQRWLRIGMFKLDEVPLALIAATYPEIAM